MSEEEPPYIRGEAKILNEKGEVIGYETVAYLNPKYRIYCINLPKTEGSKWDDD